MSQGFHAMHTLLTALYMDNDTDSELVDIFGLIELEIRLVFPGLSIVKKTACWRRFFMEKCSLF